MGSRSLMVLSASVLLLASTALVTASASSATQQRTVAVAGYDGSFAIDGKSAAAFVVPPDVRQVWQSRRPDGSTQTRYQQVIGDASVFGGQLTVLEDASGRTTSVVGAYFPGLDPRNAVTVSKSEARETTEDKVGSRGTFRNTLEVDPRTGRYFYEVQSLRAAQRPVRWIDASTGQVTKAFNALTEGSGTGVKGDTKKIDTTRNADTRLYELTSRDDRQETYDLLNAPDETAGVLMTDADDRWTDNPGVASPAQAAGVDAHYYARVVDDYYDDVFGRDSLDDEGLKIVSKVHFGTDFCNAFWNGAWMTYGDGAGPACLPLSGGLDVDGHEMTHGVTEFTSGLLYENESGALNESFSDMMGSSMEFFADEHHLDRGAEPDWRIGEDVLNRDTPSTGIRNMGDPEEFGDPSHYSQRYTGPEDNGGVHTNSGIANHAYYLAVNGGENASCTANQFHPVLLAESDCAVRVRGLGLSKAEQVFFDGFTSLPEYANFCDARNATSAVADGKDESKVEKAWDAVGVPEDCAPATPPPPPCTSQPNAQIPFESPHPYGNKGDCTYTYDNGSANFRFHFSLLDTEQDYDFVYVEDAAGNRLATYTGNLTGTAGVDGPCIPTSTGTVHLVSDPGVTAQGFTVDAVKPC